MRRRFGPGHVAALLLAVAFVLWTWLALGTQALTPLDAASRTPGVRAESARGQVLAAIAVVTMPVVAYAGLAILVAWCARRRLHNLAWAMGLSIPLTWGLTQLIKLWARRPRPETALPLITAEGYSYPSSHVAAATVIVVMVMATMYVTRRRRSMVVLAATVAAAGWLLVVGDRWWLRAHWFSDLVAGGLLGALVAVSALVLAGVHITRVGSVADAAHPGRVGIVFNPTKVTDPVVFRRQVAGACRERGWDTPAWFETDADDHGRAAAHRARASGADLIMVAGGDGTVRTVAAALSGTGIPLAILPVGTGNLLARNLDVPLDFSDAIEVAFAGRPRPIDLVEIHADDRDPEYSLVMAGMGLDALIMAETNSDLKKLVGPAAYVMAALQSFSAPPFDVHVTLDEEQVAHRNASLALIANVGAIQGQVVLAPDAEPDDGVLDVLVASPEKPGDWGAIGTRILTRASDAPGLERAQAQRVTFATEGPTPYQIDGDPTGECRRLQAVCLPHAIRVMVPA